MTVIRYCNSDTNIYTTTSTTAATTTNHDNTYDHSTTFNHINQLVINQLIYIYIYIND